MALSRLRGFLRRHRKIGIDTSVFIYQLEANSRYSHLADEVFAWLEESTNAGVTSTITMTELLVQPYRESDQRRVDEFYSLLSSFPNLDWIAPSLPIADAAARLRAAHRLATPDALQAATGIHAGASVFVTNDAVYKRVKEFETVVLQDFL